MKKVYATIKEKALTAIVWFMLSTGTVFLWNVGKDIWYLPKTVKELKANHTADSLKAIAYMYKIDSLERVSRRQTRKLYRDSLNISIIKTKLKLH